MNNPKIVISDEHAALGVLLNHMRQSKVWNWFSKLEKFHPCGRQGVIVRFCESQMDEWVDMGGTPQYLTAPNVVVFG